MIWRVSPDRELDVSTAIVLGILNLTPDSFFDGGRLLSPEMAAETATEMVDLGAAGVDIGGESTRPGAAPVPRDEQIRRVVPAIESCRRSLGAGPVISVDTTCAAVARAALDAGADVVNDVSGGQADAALLPLVAARRAGVVLMHRTTTPDRDEYSDRYRREPEFPGGVVAFVREALRARTEMARAAGVAGESIVIDPGLGFGKNVEQNLALIRGTLELTTLGFPVMSGLSRKSFVGRHMGLASSTPEQRLPGTIELTLSHVAAGARVLRVHDVGAVVLALRAAG
ncbi:MAG: dihydropteroate synthase [Phycisphaerae bacterium]|nr:dihydropteroate synthase [Phycisphaerae bacterium]